MKSLTDTQNFCVAGSSAKSLIVKTAFILPIFYWFYLFFTTAPAIVFDAVGYEDLGRLIYRQGWHEYFQTGPNREPLFPFLVALSMKLGDWLTVSYQYPLKFISMLFLMATMLGAYRLMMQMKVRGTIASLTILYMGFSPVLVDATLKVWSEIAAFPFVVLGVLATAASWRCLKEQDALPKRGDIKTIAALGVAVAGSFLLSTYVKAVVEPVLVFYLAPFYFLAWRLFRERKMPQFRRVGIFLITVFLIFGSGMNLIKGLNWKYNGHFQFTDRGDWALYGNTVRRMEPLTWRRFVAAVTVVPGTGLCQKIFGGNEDCLFWSARHSDDIIDETRRSWAAEGVPLQDYSQRFISISLEKVWTNPLQELLLMGVEAHKMFFWESSVAFAVYPLWLEGILLSKPFANTLKIVMAFLSWAGFVAAGFRLLSRRRFGRGEAEGAPLFFVFSFILYYMGVYSIFFIVDRYAFPIVSLQLVLVAYAVNGLFRGRTPGKGGT